MRVGQYIFRYTARNYWPHELEHRVAESGFRIVHTDYIWPTFENISGEQPALVAAVTPVLRKLASSLEKLPFTRAVGVSQVIIAEKPIA